MSRILRRPMFRGGRVDARGTGIASGLGYNNGGRVGLQISYPGTVGNAYDNMIAQTNQGWRNPGVTATDTGAYKDRAKWKDFTIKYPNTSEGETNLHDDYLQAILDEQALADSLGIETIDNTSPGVWAAYDNLLTPGGEKYWKEKALADEAALIKEAQATGWESENELLSAQEKSTGETRAQFEERIRRENAEELQAIINAQLSKGTPEEEIEKNKKIFQKAYGSGVADDASAMLMGLAGKMLKPEATVKSGFGEFFEEEGKRPSESKKYKDAATTAAINAYLTGQSSFKKFEDELGMYSKKLGMKTKIDKEALKDMTLAQIGGATRNTGSSASAKRKSDAQSWLDNRREDLGAKYVNDFNSKKAEVKDLFIEEYVGEFFLDQQTGEFFEIIRLEDGTIGKARRG